MKKARKCIFASLLCACFCIAFSITAGAADALSDILASLDTVKKYDIIGYDYVTGNEQVISWESIPNYSSTTSTTYELAAMASELPRLAQMKAAQAEFSVSPFSVIDPSKPYTLTPPKTGSTYNVPYSGVVYLMLGIDWDSDGITDLPNWSRATGFMVAPDVMVTAGHVFVDDTEEKWETTEVRVYPYYHSSIQPSIYYGDYIHPERWVCVDFASTIGTSEADNHDWCVVKLQEPLPDAFYFPCTYESLAPFSHPVLVSGYPTCTNAACTIESCSHQDFHQVTSEGYATQASPYLLHYDNNTYQGNSGSPVYLPSYVCVAIHSKGGVTYNQGVKITEEIYNVISYYINLN